MSRVTAHRTVVKMAWLEWLVSRQIDSGNGADYIPLFIEVPGWFWAYELGFAIPEGPSILFTAEHLEEINRAHRAILAGPRRTTSKPKPKARRKIEQAEAERRRREWRAMLQVRSSDARAA